MYPFVINSTTGQGCPILVNQRRGAMCISGFSVASGQVAVEDSGSPHRFRQKNVEMYSIWDAERNSSRKSPPRGSLSNQPAWNWGLCPIPNKELSWKAEMKAGV